MDGKVEITLRITLDRAGLQRKLGRPIESDFAFYVLGLAHAQLTSQFGDESCQVDMDAATGVRPELIRAMSSFARRHKLALDSLERDGEVTVADSDIVEVFQLLHNVIITPLAGRWRIVRNRANGCM